MIIYLPEERIGSDETMARLIDRLNDQREPTTVEMTPQARDESEGATTRAELREGVCQWTWRNYPHEHIRGDINIYRQHRCGRTTAHRGVCRCRYCGRDRGNA